MSSAKRNVYLALILPVLVAAGCQQQPEPDTSEVPNGQKQVRIAVTGMS